MILWKLLGVWPALGFDLSGILGGQHAVDELTDKTFAQHMKENPVTAIMFYAPWCFYSQQVMPQWDLAAQKLQIHDPPIKMAKIDSSRYQSVGEENDVRAYPTMKLFVDGTVFEYDVQGRQWQHIVKWVNRHLERDHVLKSVEDAETYLHDNDLAVIGLFPKGFDPGSFVKATTHYDDILFAEARGEAIANEISDHLSRHARLLCETVTVGTSSASSKEVPLPRPDMHCDGTPRNPQRPEWTDKFEVAVQGKTLTTRRTDKSTGWAQLVQIKCCDDEAKVEKEHPKFPVPSVVMFYPNDERYAVFDGDLHNFHALDKWINGRKTPSVMRLDQDAMDKIFRPDADTVPALILITETADSSEEKIFREAAQKLRGRVHACISGTSTMVEQRLIQAAGELVPPIITIIEVPNYDVEEGHYHIPRKYRLPMEGVSAEKIVSFVTDYESTRLRPWMKSEPEPSPEDMRGAVLPLVGTTFTATIQNENEDVLVDFFAPWCGHCRKFEPQYKQLAKRLKHVKSLRIAKIDATRNEVEGVQIAGFPTVILFPAGKHPKPHIVYHGSREPDDMIAWLHQECSIKFDDRPPPVKEGETAESGLLDPDEEDL